MDVKESMSLLDNYDHLNTSLSQYVSNVDKNCLQTGGQLNFIRQLFGESNPKAMKLRQLQALPYAQISAANLNNFRMKALIKELLFQ